MAKIENGMTVRVPLVVVETRDRGNIYCIAGTRRVLMDADFLESASVDVLSGPPPTPKDAVTMLAEALTALQARLAKLEAAPAGAATPAGG